MTPVKICGITRSEDAALAARLGAACVGFVFWPQSPRFVEPAAAADILAALPPHVAGVGVFVNQAIDEVNAIAERVGLGAVQLHGDESADACARCTRRVIKAVRLSAGSTPDAVDAVWSRATVLLDAFDPVRRGGTGRSVDWTLAARIARRRRTILSGGLRAENVAEAVRHVAPYGLDVSSGVESRPGIKAPERMRAFFEAVIAATGAVLMVTALSASPYS
ncbi:MAG: phosphoribosylanthranilate isomerase [Acidobacteria bacterium]|nr:MAG: phosphoribosylanthranilate isomerase [Acidobacteriota bacterium]